MLYGRVLIADDNRDRADNLAVLLADEGYTVETAYDGLRALELAVAFRPHVIILDERMPRMNGSALIAISAEAVDPKEILDAVRAVRRPD